MDITITELEKLCTTSILTVEQVKTLDNACRINNPHIQTLMEIFFLKTFREKNKEKICNIARNLLKIPNGGDITQEFFNILLSNFRKGEDDSFFYEIFDLYKGKNFVINSLVKMPMDDTLKCLKRIDVKNSIHLVDFYAGVLSDNNFIATDKFTRVFDQCNYKLEQNILINAINNSNYRLCMSINDFFINNQYSFTLFKSDITYDNHYLINAIANCNLYTFQNVLMELKNHIFRKYWMFPATINSLYYKPLIENNLSFFTDIANHNVVSKRKILGDLYDLNKKEFSKTFLETFRDDPELEEFLAFS